MSEGVVRVLRGDHVESVHRFAWRLWDGNGGAGGGEIGDVLLRSAAKPFQTLPSIRAGVLERFGLGSEHLAVSCGSHGGGAAHVSRVEGILRASGVGEECLECGTMAPRDRRARRALREPPRRLHHNCSGKHALGLALCTVEDWPLDDYVGPGHPLQQAMRDAVAEAAEVDPGEIGEATDGCGMRTFTLPLDRLAAAFARLASGRLGEAGDHAAAAMREHPSLVAFDGAIDTELMAAEPGVVAKIGAEALIAVGTPDGRGLALKILDGSTRALDPAAVLCAREVLGLPLRSPALDLLGAPRVPNSRGEVVGRLEASLDSDT